ncbi:MAG: histidine phosphatase family protein [Frankiales bacterium]|nr:MAG: histidine phosphatase family protein [Frankiales bacterium]
MPVVLLVRHGQASFGSDDYDVLSDVGREQSRVVGSELARRALRSPLVMCGSLLRQRDTAEIALSFANLDVSPATDARWDEYDHLDLLKRYVAEDAAHDGTSKGVQVLLDQALAAWVADPSGDWSSFSGGAVDALHALVDSLSPGQDAVVFTSGGVIAAVASTLLGVGSAGVVALNRVTMNGAITKLVVGGGGISLVAFNDHAHFEDRRDLVTYR